MGDMIPATLTWTAVSTGISELLGTGLVSSAVVFILAIRFGPRVIKALMNATRGN